VLQQGDCLDKNLQLAQRGVLGSQLLEDTHVLLDEEKGTRGIVIYVGLQHLYKLI